ncbi:MAG TPA: DUF922 domain-containing protein [Flavisolibacter sp.]|nr:DUF922 domain-containing protein [Flavisolibacter sp.]
MAHLFYSIGAILLVLNFSAAPSAPEISEKQILIPTRTKEDKEFIPWTEERLLTWDDFQSKPQRRSDAVASTSTSLGLTYKLTSGALTYDITCAFSKAKSWGTLKTDYILAHEQGHFDITEIYARKLHHALAAYKVKSKTYQQDIARIYQQTVKEKEHLQQLYDNQSDHSRNKKVQANWEEIIDALLAETRPYATYP